MIVVSNTSPIINLAAVGRLDILKQLYGEILIPQAVYHEIAVVGKEQPGAKEARTFPWIVTETISNPTLAVSLQFELDGGEAEAIALAIEKNADLLLLDERKGRRIATRLGVTSLGLLGVLIQARHNNYLTAVAPLLNELIVKAGFWISRPLYERVLKEAGE